MVRIAGRVSPFLQSGLRTQRHPSSCPRPLTLTLMLCSAGIPSSADLTDRPGCVPEGGDAARHRETLLHSERDARNRRGKLIDVYWACICGYDDIVLPVPLSIRYPLLVPTLFQTIHYFRLPWLSHTYAERALMRMCRIGHRRAASRLGPSPFLRPPCRGFAGNIDLPRGATQGAVPGAPHAAARGGPTSAPRVPLVGKARLSI